MASTTHILNRKPGMQAERIELRDASRHEERAAFR